MTKNDDTLAGYTDWKRWPADSFGRYSKGEARYFSWLLARWHSAPIHRALEMGFGNGNFMGFARARGITVTGLESQPELRRRAQRANFEAYGAITELAAEHRFDLIAAFDVFEHIPQDDCIALLRDMAERLSPGGILLLRVPNGESPFGRVFQHGDLTHVTTLGLSKFEQIASQTGLELRGHGELPWYLSARNPKRLLRAGLRRLIERTLAFAYLWDPDALGPNLVIALSRRSERPDSRDEPATGR